MGIAPSQASLILIPIVLIVAVWGQIVVDSGWLLVLSLLFLGIAIYFVIKAFSYHLSPNREYEILLQQWDSDSDWKEKWFKRITAKLNNFGKVKVSDLFEVGIGFKDKAKLETAFAFGKYFDVYEFEKNLILIKTSQLPIGHPDREPLSTRSEWIIMIEKT